MPASKSKIGRKIITAIINEYGGSTRYSHNDKITDGLVYDDKINLGAMLSIDTKLDRDKNAKYIEVRLTDSKGKISQTDRYEVMFEGTELYKVSSQRKGQEVEYIDEKIAYIGSNARKSRKETEQKLRELSAQNKMLMEANERLLANSEQQFLNSSTYVEMLERISYLESVNRFNESALAEAEARVLKTTDEINQIYEDNKQFITNKDDEGYFVGITENWHAAWEYEKLKQEVNRLKGNISSKSVLMIQRDNEIKKLQSEIARLKKELADKPGLNETAQEPIEDEQDIIKNDTNVRAIAMSVPVETAISDSQLEQIEKEILDRKMKRAAGYKKRGRKAIITDEVKYLIIKLHQKGFSYKDISVQVGFSVGTVHAVVKKAVSEIMNDN